MGKEKPRRPRLWAALAVLVVAGVAGAAAFLLWPRNSSLTPDMAHVHADILQRLLTDLGKPVFDGVNGTIIRADPADLSAVTSFMTDLFKDFAEPFTPTLADLEMRLKALASTSKVLGEFRPRSVLDMVLILRAQYPCLNVDSWLAKQFPTFPIDTEAVWLDANPPQGIVGNSHNGPVLALMQCLNTVGGLVRTHLLPLQDELIGNVNLVALTERLMSATQASPPLDIVPETFATIPQYSFDGTPHAWDIFSTAPSNDKLPYAGLLAMAGLVLKDSRRADAPSQWSTEALMGAEEAKDFEVWACGPVVIVLPQDGQTCPMSITLKMLGDGGASRRTFHLQALTATTSAGRSVAYVRRQEQWYSVEGPTVATVASEALPLRRASESGQTSPSLLFYVLPQSK